MSSEISDPEKPPTDERLRIAVDVWKHAVSVQMHFNDMEMKVRNLYFTILAGSLGLIGVLQGKRIVLVPDGLTLSLPLGVLAAVIPISMLFYFIDRHWYHRLLAGAVEQCTEIENTYRAVLPEIQLGSKISEKSPVVFKGRAWRGLFWFVSDSRFRESGKLHSDAKIEVLYKSVIWGTAAVILVYAFISGIRWEGCSMASRVFGMSCGVPAT